MLNDVDAAADYRATVELRSPRLLPSGHVLES
jgi:hypothetical protein